jgi:homeobox protein 1
MGARWAAQAYKAASELSKCDQRESHFASPTRLRIMTGRDALSDGRVRSRVLVPGGSPTGSRPRSFAITDLLGLEADLPAPAGPGPGSSCESPAASRGPGPGLGGSCLARGALPLGLGLGLLCGFSAQPPSAARAPCLLLADLPFLPPGGPESAAPQGPGHTPPALHRQKRNENLSTSGNQASNSRPCPPPSWLRAAQG